jgi:hypothetical protein
MGVLYAVWPLDDEMRAWLASEEVAVPTDDSRWPSRTEILDVLKQVHFPIELTENGVGERWDAYIDEGREDGWWTLLHAEPTDGNDQLTKISFEKGEPALIIALLRMLSQVTGPLALIADVGGPPLVVSHHCPFNTLVEDWAYGNEDPIKWNRLISNVPGADDGAVA